MRKYVKLYCADLNENSTLNREAAELSGLPEGENFTIANFTYANSAVVSQVFRHLQHTSFAGISVSIIAERISARQLIRVQFSVIRTYVRTCRSCLGMSISHQ